MRKASPTSRDDGRAQVHWQRWLAAAAILVVLAAIGRAFVNGQIEWTYVGRFLTAKVILEGITNTMVMAVLAMALGIVLGVVVASLCSAASTWPSDGSCSFTLTTSGHGSRASVRAVMYQVP